MLGHPRSQVIALRRFSGRVAIICDRLFLVRSAVWRPEQLP